MGGAGARGPIEFSITYTNEEYVAAARLFFNRKRHVGFERALRAVFFAGLLLIFALSRDLYFAGITAALLLGALALGYVGERLRWRKALRRDPKYRDPYRVSFAEDGIGIGSVDFEARFGWGYYKKLVETPEFLYLVYGEDLYFLVPKRALRDRREEAALCDLLRRKFVGRMETYGMPAGEPREVEREYVPPVEPPDWR